ncbi:MAG: hypothetical protein AAF800_09145 [Planctomycetota bacterium]
MTRPSVQISPDSLDYLQKRADIEADGDVSIYLETLIRGDQEGRRAAAWLKQISEEAVASGPAKPTTPEQLGGLIRKQIDAVAAERGESTA